MGFTGSKILCFIDLILLVCCVFPQAYPQIAILVFITGLLRLIFKIGNGSFFLELLYVYTSFTCLLMPLLGYVYFPSTNSVAKLWVRFMPVPQEQYFSFTMPAVIFMGLVFFLFRSKSPDDAPVINSLIKHVKKDILTIPIKSILTLTFISLIAYNLSNVLPGSLRQLNSFLYYSLFAMLFYIVFYENFPFKIYFIAGFGVFLIFDALRYGMFTIIAYMGGLFLILLLAGRRIYMSQKLGILIVGIIFITFLQLFKLDLRKSRKKGQDPSVSEVASRVLQNTQSAKFDDILFPLYFRMNQGFNIALVQRRIPKKVDYLNGGYLALGFASAFVPRLFWADKPEAGGRENMRIYTGYIVTTWSTNVGPIGEAYGNFGYWGGWIYIMTFAAFIRFAYTKFIAICFKIPILLLWMPPLFFQTIYSIEADSLQVFNSLLKGVVFMIIMYKLFPKLFPFKTTSH